MADAWRPLAARITAIAILSVTAGSAAMFAMAADGSSVAPPPARKAAAKLSPTPTPAPIPTATPAPTPTPLVVRRILHLEKPLRHGDFVWDDAGVPTGPLVITIDLAAQTISAFRDGYEIGAAAILYGADNKPTPLGVFPILEKDADHVSNLYDAPMPYMLRLTRDGVAIHASDVRFGYATHGCIGVPPGFARRLFAAAKLGDTVIVTNGKMMQMGDTITS
ncbi:L,D-transpeptidase family protein [Sphingomonas carotinifaciens]|uniref:L,D-transpeptidase family protein n=1 Tax=Sphingomonas carotinifaciens TaxID=1166323 RepID=UPI0039A34F00